MECLPPVHRETFDAAECLPPAQRERFDAVERLPPVHRERFDAAECLPPPQWLDRAILRRLEMGTSAKRPPRFVVILKLPEYEVPIVLVRARNIVERMTGNSWFPSPIPPLAVVQAATDDLSDAEATALTRVVGGAATRDVKRLTLVSQLQQLASYVESVATANPEHAASIVDAAGMYLKERGGRSPQVFRARPTGTSGQAKVEFPRAGNRASYELQSSVDGGVTWLGHPIETKANTILTGLKPATTVLLRYRAIVKSVTGDWSNVIAYFVV